MKFVLTPTGLGADYLNEITLTRGTDAVDSVILGRNDETGLNEATCPNFQYISRRHVLVQVRGMRLFMTNVATQEGVVYLNGAPCGREEIELHPEDKISFLGVKKYYNYVVSTRDGGSSMSAVHSSSEPIIVDLLDSSDKLQSSGNTASQAGQSRPIQSSARTQSIGNDRDTSKHSTDLNISVELVSGPARSASQGSQGQSNHSQGTGNHVPPAPPTTLASVTPVPPAPVPAALSPGTVTRQSEGIMKDVVKKLLRQYECSICFETLAGAVSLSPCGCCFCYACAADWVDGHNAKKGGKGTSSSTADPSGQYSAQCPHCAAQFSLLEALPNRVLDNAIREILLNLPEELQEWEERAAASNERRKQVLESTKPSSSSSGSKPTIVPGSSLSAIMGNGYRTAGNDATSSSSRSSNGAPRASIWDLPQPSLSAGQAGARRGFAAAMATAQRTTSNNVPEVVDLQDSQNPVSYPFPYPFPGAGSNRSPIGSKRGGGAAAGMVSWERQPKRSRGGVVGASTSASTSSNAAPMFDLTNPLPSDAAAPASGTRSSLQGYHHCVMSAPSLRSERCSACHTPLAAGASKVAVGVVRNNTIRPSADLMAIMSRLANSSHWLRECHDWYHLPCAKRQYECMHLRTDQLQLLDCLTSQERESVRSTFGR